MIFMRKSAGGLMETNPRWYQAVDLVYHLGMPQAEVAAELNMNLQSLHSMLHRVRGMDTKRIWRGISRNETGSSRRKQVSNRHLFYKNTSRNAH